MLFQSILRLNCAAHHFTVVVSGVIRSKQYNVFIGLPSFLSWEPTPSHKTIKLVIHFDVCLNNTLFSSESELSIQEVCLRQTKSSNISFFAQYFGRSAKVILKDKPEKQNNSSKLNHSKQTTMLSKTGSFSYI